MQLWQLLCSFLQIGLLSIGGGYAAIPLIGEQTVRLHAWLTAAEFGDLVTIAEMTPGPIAVNAASFVGMRLGGPFGAVLATVGCILPGCALSLALAALYRCRPDAPLVRTVLATLRPVTAGLIGAAALGVYLP